MVRPTTAFPRTECPGLSSWQHRQHDGLDQIDHTQRGLIYINLEQVTSIRSDTQVLGANAQLDLVSGKFQGVLEDVEQVMQLITAAAAARVNGECA